eukprot:PLAT4535.1.p1 GENE.PLAT4535.1~~PLAT4535.1.p1  ORF type:complete len:475 (+),score=233.44 PLAT4535.1:60-1484(+)
MENRFIPDAIKHVTEAIAADRAGDYETAYGLYKKSLSHFMVGLKYEKNEAKRALILKRVAGYMNRAEQLKEVLDEAAAPAPSRRAGGGGSGGAASKKRKKKKKGGKGKGEKKDGDGDDDDDEEDEDDPEKSKLRGALAGAIVSTKPDVKWSDVAGLEAAKAALKEAVILPARFPQFFTGKRRPWKGILLYGPPGTGKSYLAKAVATEADATFFAVSSADLVSKWQGESERLVRNLFEMARESRPAIIFIDEIDSLCTSRSEGESDSSRRIKTEFLVQMQGVGNEHDGILVLGATNTPWELDPAMRRRFQKRIYIPLPEAPARSIIFRLQTGDTPNDLREEDWDILGRDSDGFSGSDCSVVVAEALMEPLRHCQEARFFTIDAEGFYFPCSDDPPCAYCHPKLSTCPPACPDCAAPCRTCGAVRMSLYDIPGDKLKVPDITAEDFISVLGRVHPSVAESELERFVTWTEEFGQEG